jgi:hypothetical protein
MKIKLFLLFTVGLLLHLNSYAQTNVRGWYSDGQIWIVWESDTLNEPVTYAIYKSPDPFTNTSTAKLIGHLFKDEWTAGSLKRQSGNDNVNFLIPDGTGRQYRLQTNEGLFVETEYRAFGRPEDNLPTNLLNGNGKQFNIYDVFDHLNNRLNFY